MTNLKKTSAAALALAITTAATMAISPAAAEKSKKVEKCYGVVQAGKNDCATATSSCAGTSTKDGQKDAWIYLPKGTCVKLVGGSLSVK
jgi:uncharacterized membrane protein